VVEFQDGNALVAVAAVETLVVVIISIPATTAATAGLDLVDFK